jgi:hypothetical protein
MRRADAEGIARILGGEPAPDGRGRRWGVNLVRADGRAVCLEDEGAWVYASAADRDRWEQWGSLVGLEACQGWGAWGVGAGWALGLAEALGPGAEAEEVRAGRWGVWYARPDGKTVALAERFASVEERDVVLDVVSLPGADIIEG